MSSRFHGTRAALEQFDRVDRPAYEALRTDGKAADVEGFNLARQKAAGKVRAAFLADTADFNEAHNVELMGVDVIRREVGGTLLGAIFRFFP
ncbi:MAG TPA: hypothetical protein VFE23_21985 [Usitatibacter sp.]|jgi:hypothetical protein|nr:hypothetical protein [Usitatibacter sp.]